ncbi:hypothetical protein C5167_039432 [Papaver somniferum]|uniref:Uncharacterized protein n=1 Tax=Papaver somniferum TaxID=3469 RepID=A0A4Y7IGC8_PAPSO|nr:hypothetical protein C5167_039432 [Papaver somniferum]
MASVMRSCLQSLLKIVNSLIGMAGLALIIYALWLFRVWQKHADHWDSDFPVPCIDTVSYCIKNYVPIGFQNTRKFSDTARKQSKGYRMGLSVVAFEEKEYQYMVFLFFLVLLEAAVTADVFLNHHWEEDFPEDPTGSFDSFKHFVSSNFDICKWIGISVVAAQGLSILLSMILRALGPDQGGFYDSDDDYTPARLPLLKNPTHPPAYVVADPRFAPKSDSWNARIQDKVDRHSQ